MFACQTDGVGVWAPLRESECAEYTRERETVCVPLGRTLERGSNEPTGATLGVLVLTRPDLGLSCHFYLQGGSGVGRGRVG